MPGLLDSFECLVGFQNRGKNQTHVGADVSRKEFFKVVLPWVQMSSQGDWELEETLNRLIIENCVNT